ADAARKTTEVAKDLASIAASAGKTAFDKAPEAVRKAAFSLDAIVEMGKSGLEKNADKSV
ncbi:MAG: hypothetical protein IKL97_00405, partial [Eggerthellaceae bacterium]|nr:hypothetical protein [Eggerthellaceae bacterium]